MARPYSDRVWPRRETRYISGTILVVRQTLDSVDQFLTWSSTFFWWLDRSTVSIESCPKILSADALARWRGGCYFSELCSRPVIALARSQVPPSFPSLSVLQARESWAGPGNEATGT